MKFFNSRILKIVACVTMTFDHVGHIFFPELEIFKIIGRIAMPLFCFLIAFGGTKTKSPFKYFFRLLVCAVAMQAVYNIVIFGNIFEYKEFNVFFTLALGSLAILLLKQKNIYSFVGVPIVLALSWLLPIDYSIAGVLLIILFYLALTQSLNTLKITAVLSICLFNIIIISILPWYTQWYSLLAALFIILFSDKKLKISRIEQWLFYAYYPLHVAVIYGIYLLIYMPF